MGLPMAANLVRARHDVYGFDINPAARDAWAKAGGQVASDIATAVAEADTVITMLPAGEQVREVYLGPDGILAHAKARPLLIDCSTIDVQTAREVAAAAAKVGLALVDAPVSGGIVGAEAGTLTFMLGGADEACERARPVLEPMGRKIVQAGAAGMGQVAKICNNMILGVTMIAVAEAFVLGERLGLDRQKLFDIASASSGECWALTHYCPVPGPVPSSSANRDYAPGFASVLMLKDLSLAQEAATMAGAATPLGAHAARIYRALVDAGEGARDFSVVQPWLEDLSRIEMP
jgi:3-hydroxyisobutyrate dehydrogenase